MRARIFHFLLPTSVSVSKVCQFRKFGLRCTKCCSCTYRQHSAASKKRNMGCLTPDWLWTLFINICIVTNNNVYILFIFPFFQSHQRQHNKDKPYKCPNCYRAYSDSASLQIHLSAHAIKNAKAYCCSMCGRAYTSVSTFILCLHLHQQALRKR